MIADYIKDVTADWEQICFQTHMRLIAVPPSLAFNCTWYLSAGADHITSGSSYCLRWRRFPLYAAHFPRCPSDCAECQLLGGASGFGINYESRGGSGESGADSISAGGRSGGGGRAQVDGAVAGGRTRGHEAKQTGWARRGIKETLMTLNTCCYN